MSSKPNLNKIFSFSVTTPLDIATHSPDNVTEIMTHDEDKDTSGNSLGVILGVTLPVCVAIIILIIIFYKRKMLPCFPSETAKDASQLEPLFDETRVRDQTDLDFHKEGEVPNTLNSIWYWDQKNV